MAVTINPKYIPYSSQEVKGLLDKAGTAYQKPTGGIPSTDMTEEVQAALSGVSDRALLLNVGSVSEGDELPEYASHYQFHFYDYPAHTAPILSPGGLYVAVCVHTSGQAGGYQYYLFLGKKCTNIYTSQDVPDWVKYAFLENVLPLIMNMVSANNDPASLFDDSSDSE